MRRILVIEDEAPIRRGVRAGLGACGYQVDEAATVAEGRERACHGTYDLVLLDVQLPDGDGFSLLSEIRSAQPQLPVVMVTARGSGADRVQGLDGGADDYLVKPFNIEELRARVDAVLRRSAERPRPCPRVALPGGEADLERQVLSFADGEEVALNERDCDVLAYFSAHAGRVISRDELMDKVWRIGGEAGSSRSIDMHIVRLRAKLRDDAQNPQVLITVRGKGYRWASTP